MNRKSTSPAFYLILMVVILLTFFSANLSSAYEPVTHTWGGHIKAQGSVLAYDDQSFWSLWGDDRGFDGSLDLRLKDTLSYGENLRLETHYDATYVSGDTHEKIRDISALFPGLVPDESLGERRRLLDLSHDIHDSDDDLIRHRLDRLFVSYTQPWGDCRIGRQAVTWGNGMIFNPMDVFNPFAPTDTQRDYKIGDDLVALTWNTEHFGDIQALYIPRRDPVSGDVESDQSSWAAKNHLFVENWELDLMAAEHFDEMIAGLGLSGSMGDAAIRSDLIWSGLRNSRRDESGYVSFVMNLDYSWVWSDKKMYGLVEFYHNGLGHHDAQDALNDPDLIERIARNERFVLGRNYLGTQLRIEIHPLVNIDLNLITNLDDASAIVQPRIVWDMTQNSNLQWGLISYQGGHDSEFGGLAIPFTNLYTTSPDSMFLIVSWYF